MTVGSIRLNWVVSNIDDSLGRCYAVVVSLLACGVEGESWGTGINNGWIAHSGV